MSKSDPTRFYNEAKNETKKKESLQKKTARQRQDLHLCGRTQQISRSGCTFESVALTTVGKSGIFDLGEKESNYLGHAVDFNNFGRNSCYLSSKYSAINESWQGRGIEKGGDVLRFSSPFIFRPDPLAEPVNPAGQLRPAIILVHIKYIMR